MGREPKRKQVRGTGGEQRAGVGTLPTAQNSSPYHRCFYSCSWLDSLAACLTFQLNFKLAKVFKNASVMNLFLTQLASHFGKCTADLNLTQMLIISSEQKPPDLTAKLTISAQFDVTEHLHAYGASFHYEAFSCADQERLLQIVLYEWSGEQFTCSKFLISERVRRNTEFLSNPIVVAKSCISLCLC